MSEDIYAKPDLTKKVTFQTEETEEKDKDAMIYDNYWAKGRNPPKSQDNSIGEQQQIASVNVSPGKSLVKAPAVFLGLLCLVLIAAVIVVVVLLIHNKDNWNMERNRLWEDNVKLTTERDESQRFNHNLTLKTIYLETEKYLLTATNNNLTKERDELKKQIEKMRCPSNWIKFDKSCYFISTDVKDWTDSRKDCENYGAQLVIISNIIEQSVIQTFVSAVGWNVFFWIGLSKSEKEISGTWKWADGTALTESYWRAQQPDNNGPDDQEENCVETQKTNDPLKAWNDLTCSKKIRFICEKNT